MCGPRGLDILEFVDWGFFGREGWKGFDFKVEFEIKEKEVGYAAGRGEK